MGKRRAARRNHARLPLGSPLLPSPDLGGGGGTASGRSSAPPASPTFTARAPAALVAAAERTEDNGAKANPCLSTNSIANLMLPSGPELASADASSASTDEMVKVLRHMEQELTKKDSELADMEVKLAATAERLQAMESESGTQKHDLASKNDALNAQTIRIADLEKELASAIGRLEVITKVSQKELQRKDSELTASEAKHAATVERLNAMNDFCAAQSADLASKDTALRGHATALEKFRQAAQTSWVRWFWFDRKNKKQSFDVEASHAVERAYKDGNGQGTCQVESGDYTYLVDFRRMTQQNIRTRTERRVTRETLVADCSDDPVDGVMKALEARTREAEAMRSENSELQNQLVDANNVCRATQQGRQQLENELQLVKRERGAEVSRRQEAEAMTAKVQKQLNDSAQDASKAAGLCRSVAEFWKSPCMTLAVLTVPESSAVVDKVGMAFRNLSHQDSLHLGMPSVCFAFQSLRIEAVQSLHHHFLWKRYITGKQSVRQQLAEYKIKASPLSPPVSGLNNLLEGLVLDNDVNEVILVHGCSQKSAAEIMKTGFDIRFARSSGLYGEGIYFTSQMCKADQYTQDGGTSALRHMIVARVTLGDPHYVNTQYKGRLPPYRDPNDADKGRFDSNVANPQQSRRGQAHFEYVVFSGEQAYPEMLVTYRVP